MGAEASSTSSPTSPYFNGYIGNVVIQNSDAITPSTTYNSFTAPAQNVTLYAKWVDDTPPTITINSQPSTTCSTSKTVKATMSDTVGVTESKYAIVSSNTCDSTVTNWTDYTSASNLTIDNDTHNNKYVCFKAADAAGNTTYQITNQITNLDTTAPNVPSLSSPADNGYVKTLTPALSWAAPSGG